MAGDIARLLNSSKSDTDKLNTLLEEYLFTNEDDDLSSSDGDENSIECESDSDSEQDMRKSDYDHVLEHAKEAPEIVLDNDGELEKCREFR